MIALSKDGGSSSIQTNSIENIKCLGGHISQQVMLNSFSYTKSGLLYAAGNSADMRANPPFTSPVGFVLFSRSKDNGNTWSTPRVLDSGVSVAFENVTGFAVLSSTVVADPVHENLSSS